MPDKMHVLSKNIPGIPDMSTEKATKFEKILHKKLDFQSWQP